MDNGPAPPLERPPLRTSVPEGLALVVVEHALPVIGNVWHIFLIEWCCNQKDTLSNTLASSHVGGGGQGGKVDRGGGAEGEGGGRGRGKGNGRRAREGARGVGESERAGEGKILLSYLRHHTLFQKVW